MIGVVLVAYKSEKDTINYIKDELEKLQSDLLIVIVNVGTKMDPKVNEYTKFINSYQEFDNNRDYLRKIEFLSFEENLGYAKGNMKGVEYILHHFSEVEKVLISNNDLIINNSDILSKLVVEMNNTENCAAIGPKVVGLDGKDQSPHKKMSIWTMIIFPKLFWFIPEITKRCKEVVSEAGSGEYYRLMGSFFMVDLKKFMRVGGFDLNTFLYGEELILAERFVKNEMVTLYNNEVSVIHNHSNTISKHFNITASDRMFLTSILYYFKFYRNTSNVVLILAKFATYFNLNTRYPLKKMIYKLKNKNRIV